MSELRAEENSGIPNNLSDKLGDAFDAAMGPRWGVDAIGATVLRRTPLDSVLNEL